MSTLSANLALDAEGPVYPRYPFRTPYHKQGLDYSASGYDSGPKVSHGFYFWKSKWTAHNRWVQQLESSTVFQSKVWPYSYESVYSKDMTSAEVPEKTTTGISFIQPHTHLEVGPIGQVPYKYGDFYSINFGGFRAGDVLRLRYSDVVPIQEIVTDHVASMWWTGDGNGPYTGTYGRYYYFGGFDAPAYIKRAIVRIVPNAGSDISGTDSVFLNNFSGMDVSANRLRVGEPLVSYVRGNAFFRITETSQNFLASRDQQCLIHEWEGPMRLDVNGLDCAPYNPNAVGTAAYNDWNSSHPRWFLGERDHTTPQEIRIYPAGLYEINREYDTGDFTSAQLEALLESNNSVPARWIPASYSGFQEYRFDSDQTCLGLALNLYYASGTVALEVERHAPTGGAEGIVNPNNRLGFTEEPDNTAGYP